VLNLLFDDVDDDAAVLGVDDDSTMLMSVQLSDWSPVRVLHRDAENVICAHHWHFGLTLMQSSGSFACTQTSLISSSVNNTPDEDEDLPEDDPPDVDEDDDEEYVQPCETPHTSSSSSPPEVSTRVERKKKKQKVFNFIVGRQPTP